ncbi:hypothetical protein [Rufibacter sp. LB8]|uniref:hypothetical protein n=1 Tax=Rufibacter sp. LB8 TaxID=2777781 RepID=UPI00178C38F5|nr:hypothetical protein [Rufibacter sp. LB8]
MEKAVLWGKGWNGILEGKQTACTKAAREVDSVVGDNTNNGAHGKKTVKLNQRNNHR